MNATALSEKKWIADFDPGYFALVMATGILSFALKSQGWDRLGYVLFLLNVCFYLGCWALTGARLFFCPRRLIFDLTHHHRGVTFLTTVAATNLVGGQVLLFGFSPLLAKALWIIGILFWILFIYVFFAAVIIREPKPTLAEGISGTWLLVIVATESIVVLGTTDSGRLIGSSLILFLNLAVFLGGFIFYLPIITLILYRWIFMAAPAETLTPPYWINMGALAITALAGTNLLSLADHWLLISEMRSFLTGVTIFCWASATWWIPLLLILGIWKQLVQRAPVGYDSQYWSLVFPLGMYAYASDRMASRFGIELLSSFAAAFTFIGTIAWTWVAIQAFLKAFRLK